MSNKKYIPYEQRPIAIAGRKCLQLCNEIAARMSKMYKFQLGNQLCSMGTRIAASIYAALDEPAESEDKILFINKILENTVYLLIYTRVAKDLNEVDLSRFEELITKVISIRKQAENWGNSIQKSREEKINIEKELEDINSEEITETTKEKDEFDEFDF